MLKFSRITLAAVLMLGLGSCATSPTGRKQIKIYSPQQLSEVGRQQFDQLKKAEKVSLQQADNRYVRCITDKIIPQLPSPWNRQRWEVVVFESDQVNAFALPGNKIGVYTGMIKLTENQSQLAAVIGHELAHVIADHSNERLSSQSLIGIGVKLAEKQGGKGAAQGVGTAANLLIALPYSRTHETEADLLGLDYMAKAGFNPEQSVRLWQLMSKNSGGKKPPEILSTHPADRTRIDNLRQRMDRATRFYRQAVTRGEAPNCKRPD